MKQPPEDKKLEEILRSSKIVAAGFMGDDIRTVEEIINADAVTLRELGKTCKQVAERMQILTDAGQKGLGTAIIIGKNLEVSVNDNRGQIVCPWPHPGRYFKTATTARRLDTAKSVQWSDLSIHFIAEHGFLQGIGSAFRLEPKQLIEVIF